jgi:hypothetical protein
MNGWLSLDTYIIVFVLVFYIACMKTKYHLYIYCLYFSLQFVMDHCLSFCPFVGALYCMLFFNLQLLITALVTTIFCCQYMADYLWIHMLLSLFLYFTLLVWKQNIIYIYITLCIVGNYNLQLLIFALVTTIYVFWLSLW